MSLFEFKGKKLYYKTVGTGPLVLFVHGWVSDHKRVEKFTKGLVKSNYKVVLIDLPSFGKTTLRAFKVKKLIKILKELMTHLNAKEYHCVGVSLGASICSELSIKDERVKSFVAMVPVVNKKETKNFFLKNAIKLIKKGNFSIKDYVTNLCWETHSHTYPRKKIKARVNEILNQTRDGYLTALFWKSQIDCGKNIKTLGDKCLVIAGKLDNMVPFKDVKKYAKNVYAVNANHSNIIPQQLYHNKKHVMANFFDQFEFSKLL